MEGELKGIQLLSGNFEAGLGSGSQSLAVGDASQLQVIGKGVIWKVLRSFHSVAIVHHFV